MEAVLEAAGLCRVRAGFRSPGDFMQEQLSTQARPGNDLIPRDETRAREFIGANHPLSALAVFRVFGVFRG